MSECVRGLNLVGKKTAMSMISGFCVLCAIEYEAKRRTPFTSGPITIDIEKWIRGSASVGLFCDSAMLRANVVRTKVQELKAQKSGG